MIETVSTEEVTKGMLVGFLWDLAHSDKVHENGRGKPVVAVTGKEKIQACELIAKMNGHIGVTKITSHIGDALVDKLAGFLTDTQTERKSLKEPDRKLVAYVEK